MFLPATKPIGATNFKDDLNGSYGNWEPNKLRLLDNAVCVTFFQHSHNTARTVLFDAKYNPLMPGTEDYDV